MCGKKRIAFSILVHILPTMVLFCFVLFCFVLFCFVFLMQGFGVTQLLPSVFSAEWSCLFNSPADLTGGTFRHVKMSSVDPAQAELGMSD